MLKNCFPRRNNSVVPAELQSIAAPETKVNRQVVPVTSVQNIVNPFVYKAPGEPEYANKYQYNPKESTNNSQPVIYYPQNENLYTPPAQPRVVNIPALVSVRPGSPTEVIDLANQSDSRRTGVPIRTVRNITNRRLYSEFTDGATLQELSNMGQLREAQLAHEALMRRQLRGVVRDIPENSTGTVNQNILRRIREENAQRPSRGVAIN